MKLYNSFSEECVNKQREHSVSWSYITYLHENTWIFLMELYNSFSEECVNKQREHSVSWSYITYLHENAWIFLMELYNSTYEHKESISLFCIILLPAHEHKEETL